MDDGVVMNDVGEMSSAVSWSVDVVQSVWCYGVGRAFPECDGDDVFGESGGPCSPAWQVLVVAVVCLCLGWRPSGGVSNWWKNGVWLPHALAVVPRRLGCLAGW